MVISLLLFFGAFFLAYSNGANDNFKGVATLYGSRTTGYSKAISWATISTLAGSIFSIFLAQTLVKKFSGKGLVPVEVAGSPEFLAAVALGAGLTVIIATVTGFPISTTHGLTGALVGAGWVAVQSQVNFKLLGKAFFIPLLVSPFLAVALTFILYILFRKTRIKLGISKVMCVCVGGVDKFIPIPQLAGTLSMAAIRSIEPAVASEKDCIQRYNGGFMGIRIQSLLDWAHFISAGAVSFARGLNDTPKIFALLLPLTLLGYGGGLSVVAAGIAIGGLLNGRKVANTMSHKITPLNHGQGLTANLVTAGLVIGASRLGIPVSTTHVSVGSLFGLGLVTKKANARVVKEIIMSWVLTLPVAALLGGVIHWLII